MATSFVALDSFNPSNNTLYYRKSNKTWAAFSPAPSLSGTRYISLVLPNSNIIMDKDNTNYTVYNSQTATWTTYAKPVAVINPVTGWVVSNNLVFLTDTIGTIDQWDGTSFTRFAPSVVSTTSGGIAAISATDIMAVGGNTNIWHLEAGVWVNIGPAANTALGITLAAVRGVVLIGTTYYFIANTATVYLVFKYAAGVWTQVGANVPAGTINIDKIWGINEANMWITGKNSANSLDKIIRYNSGASTWDTEFTSTTSETFAVQDPGTFKIWGSPNAEIVCVAGGEGLTTFTVMYETTNNGTSWTNVIGPSPDLHLQGVMYREVTGSVSNCNLPNINGDFSLNHYKCLRNQFETNDRWANPTVVPFSKAHSGLNLRKNEGNTAYTNTPGVDKDK